MTQTAVEWLLEELDDKCWYYLPWSIRNEISEQAKQMEKQQIIDVFNQGNIYEGNFFDRVNITAEQYYNQTFKSE